MDTTARAPGHPEPELSWPCAVLVVSSPSDLDGELLTSANDELVQAGHRVFAVGVPSESFDELLTNDVVFVDVVVAFGPDALSAARPLLNLHECAARVLVLDDPSTPVETVRHAARLADALVATELVSHLVTGLPLRPPLVSLIGPAPATSDRVWLQAAVYATANRRRVLDNGAP